MKKKLKELLRELKKFKVQTILVLRKEKKRNDRKIFYSSAKLIAIVGEQIINPLANCVRVVISTTEYSIISNFVQMDANFFLIFVYFSDQNFEDSVSSENKT